MFPDGGNLLPPEKVTGSVNDTAKATMFGPKPGVTYQFMFWDVGGTLLLDRRINYTPTGDDFATAWYLEEGGGGGACQPNCAAATWAFSLTQDEVMKGQTPIGSVSPSGLWTSPSTSASTMASGPVTITARASVAGQTFVHWLQLPHKSVVGNSFTVPAQTDSESIGFYRQGPTPPVKPICPPSGNPNVRTCF